MTYIIAGKLKDKTFMMSDCISAGAGGELSFACKTFKHISTEDTYSSLTGSHVIDSCTRCCDEWYYINKRPNDFIGGLEAVGILVEMINRTLPHYKDDDFSGDTRIFFQNRENVAYYDFAITKQNQIIAPPNKKVLAVETFVNSAINRVDRHLVIQTTTLREHCVQHVENLKNTTLPMLNFRDRFTYVELNADRANDVIEWPYHHPSDFVAAITGVDYDMIDDANFTYTP